MKNSRIVSAFSTFLMALGLLTFIPTIEAEANANCVGANCTQTFNASASAQTFTPPYVGVQLRITVNGAGGGRGGADAGGGGGSGIGGNRIVFDYQPSSTAPLYLYIGNAGGNGGGGSCSGAGAAGTNPWTLYNGGRGGSPGCSGSSGAGGGGGSATVVSTGDKAGVVAVAGGGGGGGGANINANGTTGKADTGSQNTSTVGANGQDWSGDGSGGGGGGGGATGGTGGTGSADGWNPGGQGGVTGRNLVPANSNSVITANANTGAGSITISWTNGPAATTRPSFTNSSTAKVGQVLIPNSGTYLASGGTVTVSDPRWQISTDGNTWTDVAPIVTGNYTIQPEDVGKYVRFAENATDSNSTLVSASSPSLQITGIPAFTAETLSGTASNTILNTVYGGYTFQASGFRNTFSISEGNLPPGIALNPTTGELAGTATATGIYKFKVRVTNEAGNDETAELTIVVGRAPVFTSDDSILQSVNRVTNPIRVGTALPNFVFTAAAFPAASFELKTDSTTLPNCGTAPNCAYTYETRALPPGLTFDAATGTLSGTPTQAGAYVFAIQANNSLGSSIDTIHMTVARRAANLFTLTSDKSSVVIVQNTTVTATITAAGGEGNGAFSFAVDPASAAICSVVKATDTTATMTVTTAGNCVINGTKAADGNFAASRSSITIPVNKAAQTAPLILTPDIQPFVYGNATWIRGTGGNGTGAFTFAMSQNSPAGCATSSQSGNSMYSALTAGYTTAGTCTYTVTKAGDNFFLPQTTTYVFEINKANQSPFSISSPSASNWNATSAVTHTLTPSGGTGTGAVTYFLDPTVANACTLSGNVLTARNAGTCTVTAIKAGDANYNQASAAPVTWTINQISQTALAYTMTTSTGANLAWNGSTTYVANPTPVVTINMSGGSGNGAYAYVASGGSGCVVQGAGAIAYVYVAPTGSGIGSCVIAITKASDVNFLSATASTQFSISAAPQAPLLATAANPSMDFVATTLTDASTAAKTQITVTGGLGTGAVSYAVSGASTSVCSVDSSGLITNKTAGSCVVNVTKAADSNYQVQTTSVTVTFNKLNQSELVANPADASEPFVWSPKATNQITTTGGSGTGTVTYTVDPSTSSVCSVGSSNGLITNITAGTCLINVTKAADTNYNVANDQVSVVFTKIDPSAISLSASPTTLVYTPAANKNQTWVVVSGGANSTGANTFFIDPMTEENCSIASVQADRILVNGNLAGFCLVAVVKAADVNYNEIRTMMGFSITKMVQTISASSSQGTSPAFKVAPETTTTINVTGQQGTGTTRFVVDPTANTSNCSIDQTTGTVTSTTVGSCRITVSRDGDDNVQASNSVVINLTISKTNQSAVTLTPAADFRLAAVGSAAATSPLTLGLSYTGTGNFTRIVSTTPLVCTINGGGDSTLTPPTFTASANPSITVTAVNDGTCTLQYTKLGDANFNVATNFTASFTINKATQAEFNASITAGSESMPFVMTPKATATVTGTGGSGTGAINYTVAPSSSTICSVNLTTGVVTNITAGTCVINVRRLTDNDYAESDVKVVTITFTKIDQTPLVLNAAKTALRATTSALDTTTLSTTGGSGTGALTYAVDQSSSGICSISGTTVTGLGAGECNITATKAADVNYNVATATIKLTITKGAQATFAAFWWNQPNLGTGTQANPTPFNPTSDQINYYVTSGGTGSGDLVFAIDPASATVCTSAKIRPGVPSQIIVTALSHGECKVSAYKAGGTAWEDSNVVTASFWIGRINQAAITATPSRTSVPFFDSPAATFTVAVTGGNGTGANSISIAPASAAICSDATVEGGVITVRTLGVGNCLLTGVKAASPGYNQATSSQITVTITKGTQAPIVMSASPSELTFAVSPRATSTLTVTGGSGNGAVTVVVDSGSTAVCSYNSVTGVITAIQSGRCDLTATKAAGADGLFNAATGKLSVVINKIPQARLNLTPVTPFITYVESPKQTTALNLTGGTGTGAVSYSLDPGSASVCTLAVANGVATITANYFGFCVINATKAGDVNYAPATATTTVRISQPGTQIIATVPNATESFVPAPGFVTTVTVEGSKEGDILSYSVDADSRNICAVSGTGTTARVTALGQGECNVIAINVARAPDGTLIASSSVATFTITKGQQLDVVVTPDKDKINFAVPAATNVITVSGGVLNSTITATVDPASAEICSVTVTGNKITMTALQVGDCKINIAKEGNAGFLDYETSITVPVLKTKQADLFATATPAGLTYSPTNPATTTLSTVGGSGTGDVTYAVTEASASICSVTGNIVTVITGGDCVVVATKAGDVNFAEMSAAVTIKIVKGNQAALEVDAADETLQYVLGETVQTSLSTTGGSGDGAITYAVTEDSALICALDGNNVLVLKAGNCVIRATKASDPYFNSASATVTIVISKGIQAEFSVDTRDESIQYLVESVSRTELLPSGGSGNGVVSYAVEQNSLLVCALQASNIVALRAGFCTITATKASDSDFLATSASVTIEITKGPQAALLLTADDATLAYVVGTTVKTRLSVSGGSGTGAISYAVALGSESVCSLVGNQVTALTSGDCELIATKASDANFLPATDSFVIKITKGLQAALSVSAQNPNLTYSATNMVSTTVSTSGGSGTGAVSYAVSPASASVCSVSGNVVTVITGGDCVIVATKAGDVTFEPATASTTIKIAKGAQATLVLSAADESLVFNNAVPQQTGLIVSGGSGEGELEFSVAPSSASICKLDGSNIVALRAGTCIVTATKKADAFFEEATDSLTIQIAKAAQRPLAANTAQDHTSTPEWNGIRSTEIVISGGDGFGALVLEGLTPGICSVELVGQRVKVTAIAAGSCAFRVNKDGDYNYLAATGLVHSIAVGSAETDLEISIRPLTTHVAGRTGNIEVTVTNIGAAAAAGASVDYTLPTGLTAGSPLPVGCVSVNASLVRCTSTAIIPVAGSVKFTIPVAVPNSFVGGEITEGAIAIVSSNTPDSEDGNNLVEGSAANFIVHKAPGAFNKTTLNPMQTGIAFNDLIEVSGFPAVTYAVSTGALPAGLTLSPTTGQISGIPTGFGAYNFTIIATNEVGSVSRAYSGSVAPIPVVTVPGSGFATNTVPAGTRVTIAGTNLDLITSAIIGGRLANIVSKNANQVVLDVPNATSAGEAPITLVYAQGNLLAGSFTYTGVAKLNPVIVISAGASTATAAEAPRTLTSTITAPGAPGQITLPVIYSSKTTAVCTVAGDQLTFLVAGLCTLTATTASTAVLNAGTAADVSVSVAKSDQTVNIVLPQNTVPPTNATDSADGFELTASATSGLPVVFAGTTPAICDVTDGGFVIGIKPGVCIVNVSQAGNARFNAASPVRMEFTITKDAGGPSIDPGDPSKPTSLVGGALTNMGDAAFSWNKTLGHLRVETYGIWIGRITAVSEFRIAGKAYKCTVNFGTLKAMPSKTPAQLRAAMAKKTFKAATPFCNSKTEAAAFTALKKGYNGLQVKVTITRFRMYPTTYKPINAKTKKPITTQIRTVYLTLG